MEPQPSIDEIVSLTGAERGGLLAVTQTADGVGLAGAGGAMVRLTDAPGELVRRIDEEVRPRWVLWSADTALALARAGVRVATSWDLAAAHRLLVGGWRADPGRVWAQLHDLPTDELPVAEPENLFTNARMDDDPDPDGPIRPDGHLRAEWAGGGWADADRLSRWAGLALAAAQLQQARLAAVEDRPATLATARSESAAELLGAELTVDGLPLDRAIAERIIAGFVGPRPRTEAEAAEQRAVRDAEVLRHAPDDSRFDLRSPGQVKSLLRRVGIEVADTRAWRLEAIRDEHPIVDALLAWRKA